MVNHPNRSTRGFHFIAFNMVSQNSLAHADTPQRALELAAGMLRGDTSFLEVLDCGTAGRKLWDHEVFLWKARPVNRTVFRGAGYAPEWEPVEMEA